ncbi:MAG: serine/threonine protein kinase [Sandaracinaceae bacterium]|nr:serine/threonine protein kinase [Sandaracinaceae bacterium]
MTDDTDTKTRTSGGLQSTIFDEPRPETSAGGRGSVAFGSQPFADRYALVSQLGVGGMGEVWLIRDRQLERGVALKTVRQDKLSAGAATRFADEVLLQAQLDHPAFVPVHEVGVGPSGEPYFTMRRVEGHALSEALAATPLDDVRGSHRLLRAFAQVCAAVHFAHDQGIVHRDLKPANIMLGGYGEVYVLDLGIAQRVRPDDASPQAAPAPARAGTPGYMAPEQASAPESVDVRADVYALGCILFEILTRSPLHDPEALSQRPLEEVYRSASTSPRALAERRGAPPITQELDEACCRALALSPADRTLSAMDLHDAVVTYLDGAALTRFRQEEASKLSASAAELIAQAGRQERTDSLALREEALTTLGRAVSLAPADEATRATIRTLLQQPPPPDAASVLGERVRAWEEGLAEDAISGVALALCGWVLSLPALWWMGVRDLGQAARLVGVGAATLLWLLAFVWRKPPRRWALLGIGALSTATVVLTARWLGPFGIAPAIFVGHMCFFSAVPDRSTRNGLVAMLVAGALWPAVELLGTGSVGTMQIVDDTIVVRPLVTDFPPLATWSCLLLLNLAVMIGAGASMRVFFRRMEATQRGILWHQWQIEALMSDAKRALDEGTQAATTEPEAPRSTRR